MSIRERQARARADYQERRAELIELRAEHSRLLDDAGATAGDGLGEWITTGDGDPPLLRPDAFGFCRAPVDAALHAHVIERRTMRCLRELLALLHDEPHARRIAAWLLRRGEAP